MGRGVLPLSLQCLGDGQLNASMGKCGVAATSSVCGMAGATVTPEREEEAETAAEKEQEQPKIFCGF